MDQHMLRGHAALVTGATSGLGRHFAMTLAAAGASVVATGRRLERLEDVVQEIEAKGGSAVAVPLDVTDETSIVQAVELGEASFGPLGILVNNAGIPDAQRAHKMSVDLVDRVIDTNLRGPFLLSCEVARRLIAAQLPGRIVNVSSISAYQYAGEGAALYSITKAAINRMTEVLAVEWVRHGINVTGIAPGFFSSEMTDGMIGRVGDFTDTLPRRRLGEPNQLESTLLYLVAPESELVTGTIVKVDDGQGPR